MYLFVIIDIKEINFDEFCQKLVYILKNQKDWGNLYSLEFSSNVFNEITNLNCNGSGYTDNIIEFNVIVAGIVIFNLIFI